MAQSITLTGAHVVLAINGKVVGRVTSFEWQSDTPHRAIYEIDNVLPAELAPGATRVTGRIGLVRTRRDAGAEGAGLTVPLTDLPRERYMTLLLTDRVTDTVVFRCDAARVTGQSWSARPKGVVAGTVNFQGIASFSEARPRGAF